MLKNKKLMLRLLAFIAAVIAAVVAFTSGILQLGHRDSGYYDVGLTAEGNALLYGSGAHLLIYAEGGSSDIRRELTAAQKAFTEALSRAYKLLDADNSYEGMVNIASLNQHPGERMRLAPALYAVLADASARMDRGEGYNLFAGPLFRAWRNLLYLEEPQEADPLNDPDEAELLAAITELVNRPGMFSLDLSEENAAALIVSPEYGSFAEAQEIEGPILDLNLLHDAYLLDMTAAVLQGQGITGYLYTDSGCSIWLEAGDTRYTLYGAEGAAGAVQWPSPSAFCQFTAYSLDDTPYGYYRVGETLRHPFIDAALGAPRDVLLTAALAGDAQDLPDLAYEMAILCAQPDRAGVEARLQALPEDIFYAYLCQGPDAELVVKSGFEARVDDQDKSTLKPD